MSILRSSGGAQAAAAANAKAPAGRAGEGDVDVVAAFGGALANAIAALLPGLLATPAEQAAASGNDAVKDADAEADATPGLEAGASLNAGTPSAAVMLRAGAAAQGADPGSTTGLAPVADLDAGAGNVTADAAAPQPSTGDAADVGGPGRPGRPGRAAAAASNLDPAFSGKLDRVIERMHDEFGINVKVVEGLRSQARQDWLYEQGRTRPGPVVTWTHNSNHTRGLAADLQLVNVGSAGYRTLAQVAAEEGLHTLGAADPGHVELQTGGAALATSGGAAGGSRAGSAGLAAGQGTDAAGVAGVAPVARPAAVADVARVAAVAEVAQVAVPGLASPRLVHPRPVAPAASRPDAPATPGPARPAVQPAPDALPEVGAAMASTDTTLGRSGKAMPVTPQPASPGDAPSMLAAQQDAASEDRSGRRRDPGREAVASASDALSADGTRGAFGQTAAPVNGSAHVAPVAHGAGVDVAARVAQVQAAQEAGDLRPLSRVLLHLGDSAQDGTVRVSLRGSSVEASIALSDTGAAERLGERLGELRTALEQHGYETGPLAVRSAAAATEAPLGLAAAANPDRVVATTATQTGNASQERRDGSENRGAPQGGHDRPRPRREQRKENEA